MEGRRRTAAALLTGAALGLISLGRADAARSDVARRMLQQAQPAEQVTFITTADEENSVLVDPGTCALGQYTLALSLTSASIPKGSGCLSEDGTVSPYVQIRVGAKTIRSKTKAEQYPAFLEDFQFGCQDVTSPIQIQVVNSKNSKACLTASLRDWSLGRHAAFTELQAASDASKKAEGSRSAEIIKDVMVSFPFHVQDGNADVDLTVVAYPGPTQEQEGWSMHTQGDIAGIVLGMLLFVAFVALFVYKIRQSTAGVVTNADTAAAGSSAAASSTSSSSSLSSTAPSAPEAAVPAGKKRHMGKLGVENQRGADSA